MTRRMVEKHVWETGHLKEEAMALQAEGHHRKGFMLGVVVFSFAQGARDNCVQLLWVAEPAALRQPHRPQPRAFLGEPQGQGKPASLRCGSHLCPLQ